MKEKTRKMNNDQLLEDLFQAYFEARKNKRNKRSALEFEINFEENLFGLFDEIKDRTYEPGKSVAFVVENPVKREVFAAKFRDRVIHHLLFNYLEPVFEPLFIADSYSCRKNKGTLYGINRVARFARACSKNYKKESYVLKLDISGYFMNMNKELLYYVVEEELSKERDRLRGELETVRFLLKKVIFSDPTRNYEMKGKRKDWQNLPKSKSLFFAGRRKGLPIGNLTSQLFGNIYLNGLDHFVKRELKVKYYGRYVDDMVFIASSKEKLRDIKRRLDEYLKDNLGLVLHPGKIYLQRIENGFSFLGAKIRPYRILAGKRIKGNFYKKIYDLERSFSRSVGLRQKKRAVSVFNSYLGMLGQFDTYLLRKKLTHLIYNSFGGVFGSKNNYRKIVLTQGGVL